MTPYEVNEKEFMNQVSDLAADLYGWRLLARAKSMAEPPPAGMDERDLAQSAELAKTELSKPRIKRALCASLKSTSNNVREVAKVVVATLLPLSLAGTIALPATPLAFASAAVLLFDAGVAAFCADQKKDDEGQ